jgi:hypothetical protein
MSPGTQLLLPKSTHATKNVPVAEEHLPRGGRMEVLKANKVREYDRTE